MAVLIPVSEIRAAQQDPSPSLDELLLAMSAKIACSAVFITGREAEDALVNSAAQFWRDGFTRARIAGVNVDRAAQEVTLRLDTGVERSARYYGDQGCIIMRPGIEGIAFDPVPVASALPDPATQAWPMGDVLVAAPPVGIDQPRMRAAVDLAVAEPDDLTLAFIAVYKGAIIAERYAEGVTRDTQLESWSMGKSITAALVGVLAQQGRLTLDQPAPIAEWSAHDDPRRHIRIADLMRMSSGLQFSGFEESSDRWKLAHPDHFFVYSGAVNVFDFSINQPLEFPPNTVGRYRNCDALILGAIVRRSVEAAGEEYLSWPQRALFDRIGIRRQVLETDPYGNFILTGYDYGTARNWARLGLLFLNDGEFEGEHILPPGWTDFCATPAPAWDAPVYGGLFRLNGDEELNLPKDAMIMSGGGVSKTVVLPSHDLVLVRMGHLMGRNKHEDTLNQVFGEIMASINPSGDGVSQ